MIGLSVDGAHLEVWRSAASTMPDGRVAALLPELRELVEDGFPGFAGAVGDDDLVHHFLGPSFGAYQFIDGRLRAMTAADILDLEFGRTLYFSLSEIHSSLRGLGLYEQMLLLRIAIGRSAGCQWWATRTQSPIVAHSFARFGAYPWHADEALPEVAAEVAEVLYEEFSGLGRRDDERFDPATGVLRSAYPSSPYTAIPTVDNAPIQDHFDAHIEAGSGDALLLMGTLDEVVEALAPRCDARFGMSFDQLCELLAGV